LRGNWIKGSISIRQPFTQLTAESNTIWGQFTNEKSNSDFPNNEYIAVDSSGPSSPVVKIHPNEYDSTRYHVAIINPTEQATVDVDVSAYVSEGSYALFNAQNPSQQIASGSFVDGIIPFPTQDLEPAQPIASDGPYIQDNEKTGSQFNAYIVYLNGTPVTPSTNSGPSMTPGTNSSPSSTTTSPTISALGPASPNGSPRASTGTKNRPIQVLTGLWTFVVAFLLSV
jgi:hypothetical protein